MENEFVLVEVESLLFDDHTKSPVVVLKAVEGEEGWILPIWIGAFEATAMAMELENVSLPRPFTHDLMKNLISMLGGELIQIEIHSNVKGTYMANMVIMQNGEKKYLDARPSDSIILAMKYKAKIYANPSLLQSINPEEMKTQYQADFTIEKEPDVDLGSLLRDLRPEDFGRNE
ncbi:MAG: bifunctional nuclease family protein [Candidatus Coatesbacteria bacterium]|nr:bifunctional nuclease family protein [Candidatus Coatesbacteria bacterium]